MSDRKNPIILANGEGRSYDMGGMHAVFKADEGETDCVYSISEWWLDSHTAGPGAHSHADNDDIFFIIEGTITFLIGDTWTPVAKGGFVRAAAGVTHDYRNDTDQRAGMLNIYIPGGFEREMPEIVRWFAELKTAP